VHERKGSLFVPNFKRKEITSYKYLTNVIHYIHSNPVHYGFVKDIYDWPHSSFHTFLSGKNTILKRDDVLQLYGGIDEFIGVHRRVVDKSMILDLEF
jgi:putative transposase